MPNSDKFRADPIFEDVAIVKSELVRVRNDIDKILKIVIEGNGQALVSKIAVLESRLESLEEILDEKKSDTFSIRLAVITAIFSFFGSMGLIVFEWVMKK